MSTMRILVNDKERRIKLATDPYIYDGKMFIEATTGEVFFRSLNYMPMDRHGWQPSQVVSALPNPAVMHAHKYFRYCAAHYATKPGRVNRHFAWANMSYAKDIVFG